MKAFSTRLAGASLMALAAAACTTSGYGTGQSVAGNLGATFSWTETGGTQGTMLAHLTNGEVFQGPMFQITAESRYTDYGSLWYGWGGGFGWGHGWAGHHWGWGWDGWGPWGPDDTTVTHYSGQVLANLQGPTGFMRCHFTLMSPSYGMAGGGLGQCQLPSGTIINAQFPRHY